MAKKIFIAFTHEQPNDQITKEFSNVFFAFADDENHLHFGAKPKKSYLLTPAQAANVIFSERTAGTRVAVFHCIDITKKELKTLRKEFKKKGFMPYDFFEKVMLDEKYFSDATVVFEEEPKPEAVEVQKKLVEPNNTVADSDKCAAKITPYCLRRFTDDGSPVLYRKNSNSSIPKLYRTFLDANFAAYELNLREGSGDWEAIEY